MRFTFKKAERSQQKLRAAIDGPSGSGKTFSALRLGFSLIDAGLATKLAVIDTENGSASLYAGESPDGQPWQFDALKLDQFNPDQYVAAIQSAEQSGYDVIVIDSISHAWQGKGGVLDIVDAKGGKFTAWKDATPIHRKLIDGMIQSKAHIIATMRSKTDYVMETVVNSSGKEVQAPKKIGTAPIQREGMEYEFDVYGSVDISHQIKISKSRCSAMQDATGMKPGPAFWRPMFDWLKSATPATETPRAMDEPGVKGTPAADPPPATQTNGKPSRLSLSNMIAEALNLEQLQICADALNKAVADKHISSDDVAFLGGRFKTRKEQILPATDPAFTGSVPAGSKS
jgi:hypothetical protein